MDMRPVYTTTPDRPLLIMVPGFFTKPLTPGIIVDRSWDLGVISICKSHDLNGCVVNWNSGNILDLNFSVASLYNGRSLESALRSWRSACDNAEQCAVSLSQYIQTQKSNVYLLGHSLGGRIALRVAESLPLTRLIALAPAIDIHNVDYTSIVRSVAERPAVCYSHRDRVLSTLFTCGQSPHKIADVVKNARLEPGRTLRNIAHILNSRASAPALGLVGVPKSHASAFTCVDTRLRHAEYVSNVSQLWSMIT